LATSIIAKIKQTRARVISFDVVAILEQTLKINRSHYLSFIKLEETIII